MYAVSSTKDKTVPMVLPASITKVVRRRSAHIKTIDGIINNVTLFFRVKKQFIIRHTYASTGTEINRIFHRTEIFPSDSEKRGKNVKL